MGQIFRSTEKMEHGLIIVIIAIQGLSNMLNISFCIVSTQNPNKVQVYPSNGNGIGTIHLGLLGQ